MECFLYFFPINSIQTFFALVDHRICLMFRSSISTHTNNGTLNSLANLKNPAEFWRAVRRFKNKSTPNNNPIDINIWENFYAQHTVPKLYILCTFNIVLESEMIPVGWFTTTITLLHKKECKLDPANYRGIALINHCSQLFTSMLNRRLDN